MPDTETTTTDGEATSTGGETTTTTETSATEELGDAGKKALDAERDARKSAEKAARDALRELDELKKQHMSDTEKLVAAEFRAATAGRNLNVDTLLEGIDTSKFLDDAGDVDAKAIGAFVDAIAPKPTEEPKPTTPTVFDLGQGTRNGNGQALGDDPLLEMLKPKLGLS